MGFSVMPCRKPLPSCPASALHDVLRAVETAGHVLGPGATVTAESDARETVDTHRGLD